MKPNFFTKKEEETSTYGKFVLELLPFSFGNSLGNTLRRTLLSSLRGSAITQIKVAGAPHLFSTIKGVKESVLEIVLNLKQLRFQTTGEGKFRINLDVKGSGKITSKDITGEAKTIDENAYLAEITDDKGKLDIEAVVENGIGYSQAEDRDDIEFGFTAVDAFFSPVRKVNFKVEEAAVGRRGNLERLIIEIYTDGSISPSDSLRKASLVAADYFNYILSGQDNPQEKVEKTEAETVKEQTDKKLNEIIIDELDLPSRVINALLRENIETVSELIKVGREKLSTYKGVGKKSVALIEEELEKLGVTLE